MTITIHSARALALVAALACIGFAETASAQCGNGVIAVGEACDDGNLMDGDGCSMGCTVETGFGCVPTLFATGVNDAGDALPPGAIDPHWTWSQTNDENTAVPAIATQNPAWPNHPPGRWVSATQNYGNELTTGVNTFWFQRVEVPAGFAGALTFPIVVSCDNTCEVFVNGMSFGGHNSFLTAGSINIPASAFVEGSNLVTVQLVEGSPGTPRGILIYPGGGGILSQCTERCMSDAECDDGNSCTTDTCLLTACTNTSRMVGSSCSGGACNGDPLFPECIACVDTSPTGMDAGCGVSAQHCRATGGGSPVCEPCLDTAIGSTTDQGCTGGSPYCVAGIGGNSCIECLSPADCGDANTCTEDLCTGGTCSNPPEAVGTPCAGGACNGTLPVCEICVDSGGGTDTGCSAAAPHCIGASGMRMCVECTSAGQCDDGMACTTDACTSNACTSTAVAEGMTGACTGGAVCSGAPTNMCVVCTDTSGMGTDAGCMAMAPHCRTTGLGAPSCEECLDTAAGMAVDLGCGMGNPLCVGGSCVECVTPADCVDGNACTDDLCAAGTCSNPPLGVGAMCTGGVCDGMVSALCEVCVDSGIGLDLGCDATTPHCAGASGSRSCVAVPPGCGDGVIAMEECDDGNMANGDGCSSSCIIEAGFGCVPSLFATGVNDAGDALPPGGIDPHWTWSETNDESTGVPAIATQNPAWPNHPPGRWVAPTQNFGNELNVNANTFWFQRVEMPAAFAGTLTFPIVVSCDNDCEVFVNGMSFGGHDSFLTTNGITIPASAFEAGSNLVTVRLFEEGPGTPRGILIYPGSGGILSQCTPRCTADAECDDGIECTTDTCLLSACTNASNAAGSTCMSGVCNGDTLFPMCVPCTSDTHCDDGNPCTDDACGATVANTCDSVSVMAGDTGMCTGGAVCSGTPTDTCVACLDTEVSGTDLGCTVGAPFCDEDVGGNTCEICVDGGPGTDLGCDVATPNCVVGTGGANECVSCAADADCNDGNECTTEVCDAGACTNPGLPELTPCTGGICNGDALAPMCVECTNDTHCDDGNPCTVDACGDTIANTCDNTPVPAGDTGMCTGGELCSGTPMNTCVTCADTDASGTATDAGCTQGAPFCDVDVSGRSCEVCVDDGAGTDLGCAAAAPNCVVGTGGANECIACTTGADCGDGNECTEDVCTVGVCTNPPLPEFTPCTGGVCTQAAVCMMTGPDAGMPDAGTLPDGGMATGVGGLSGGAMCATHAPVGAGWPAAGGLLLVGLALATRRRRR